MLCFVQFVLRMRKTAISQLLIKFLTLQLDLATPIDFLYGKKFWRSMGIYHMILTFDPLILNTIISELRNFSDNEKFVAELYRLKFRALCHLEFDRKCVLTIHYLECPKMQQHQRIKFRHNRTIEQGTSKASAGWSEIFKSRQIPTLPLL